MSVFALTYTYIDSTDELNTHRPAHRAFLQTLADQSVILASGPLPDGQSPQALLLVQAESEAHVWELLNEDPFYVNGLISLRQLRPWNPVIGQFQDLSQR